MNEDIENQDNKNDQDKNTTNQSLSLEELKQIDNELTFSVKELQHYLEKIQHEQNEWSEQQKQCKDILVENVNKLAKETKILTILPEKIENRLTSLVPNISRELAKQIFDEFDNRLAKTKIELDDLLAKSLSAIDQAKESQQTSFRQKLRSLALILSISIIASSILSFLLMQQFPKTISINTEGNITIDGGDVSIWGTGKNSIINRNK